MPLSFFRHSKLPCVKTFSSHLCPQTCQKTSRNSSSIIIPSEC
uniref:Uncharacterized protein n=1 Tax=Anguilla anguilla TaxID=7936 RepID=A0A0E9R8E3_ANGAN